MDILHKCKLFSTIDEKTAFIKSLADCTTHHVRQVPVYSTDVRSQVAFTCVGVCPTYITQPLHTDPILNERVLPSDTTHMGMLFNFNLYHDSPMNATAIPLVTDDEWYIWLLGTNTKFTRHANDCTGLLLFLKQIEPVSYSCMYSSLVHAGVSSMMLSKLNPHVWWGMPLPYPDRY